MSLQCPERSFMQPSLHCNSQQHPGSTPHAIPEQLAQWWHSLPVGTHSLNRKMSRVLWCIHIFMGGRAVVLPATQRAEE